MVRVVWVAVVLALPVATSAQAQQRSRGFEEWQVPGAAVEYGPGDPERRDYRYEGLAVGGIVLGALGAWVGSRISLACPTVPGADCTPDRLGNAVALGLASGVVGGGLGFLIGLLSPKPGAPPE